MGKINGCLKCVFIFFNVLYAIFGCLMIWAAVQSTAVANQVSAVGGPSTAWIWVFAIGIFGISCLGIFAACSEKGIALKIFAGFMVAGMIIMLILGIIVVVFRNKVKDAFTNTLSDSIVPYMKDEEFRSFLEGMQESTQCCGVVSTNDWGNEIPQSCKCSSRQSVYGSPACKARPQGATGPDQVFKQTCGEVLFGFLNIFFQISMAFFFGFAVTALLGLLVSLLMIHQVNRHDSAGGSSIAMKGY
ncbi:tetraspanin-7-like [Morone saxatilis]|uniref:tetraspanin-7-like n=1 Tax=Morone saxatilis TaxID=34816 RepID=UPI0015E1D8A1|nr:tetraspanin-7-like [Morone saxatilis]